MLWESYKKKDNEKSRLNSDVEKKNKTIGNFLARLCIRKNFDFAFGKGKKKLKTYDLIAFFFLSFRLDYINWTKNQL